MSTSLYYFADNEIRVFESPNEPWFCGHDVAKILGYKRTRKAIADHVDADNKATYKHILMVYDVAKIKNKQDMNMIYIDTTGLTSLLCKSKMPNKCDFVEWCSENFDVCVMTQSFLTPEQDTIGCIIRAFSDHKYARQFAIGRYRIDLYFSDAKVAIECDEHNHHDRDEAYETERQQFIERQLSCTFIRYDPNERNFDIFKVIQKIMSAIYG